MANIKRSFLLLQGPCSPLFPRIADQLLALGHAVHKINFNSGDLLYWQPKKSLLFRDRLSGLNDFMASVWTRYGITDQLIFGNCRPVHKPAIDNAAQFGIRTFVVECGYFRPYWITLECDGVNGHSLLPRHPDWYRKVAKRLPEQHPPEDFKSSFAPQAVHDVIYHLAGVCNPLLTPYYNTHSPYSIYTEYSGFVKRSLQVNTIKRQELQQLNELLTNKIPFYLFPLQLNSDAQITHYSNFNNMAEAVKVVLASFAQYAPQHTRLVIKNHPLDIGQINYKKIIGELESAFNIAGRTVYFESGDTRRLLQHTLGTVTVNSTTAGVSLALNRPTITLADSIFSMDGLTFQGKLDDFWTKAQRPDPLLFADFHKTVIYATQINGGLYSQEGTKLAAYHAAQALTYEKCALERCYDLY